jgi:transposase-like protein
MVERTPPKRIKLFTVENRSKETLIDLIRNNVESDTIIYTDCWKGYNGLSEHFIEHQTVNHSVNFVDPITLVHTNTIEGSWNGVKMQVPIRNRSKNKICLYLARYIMSKDHSLHPLKVLLNYLFYFIFYILFFIFRGYFFLIFLLYQNSGQ